MFPVDVIAKYNARIKELGSEKIAILAKTKVFRRKINLISWEAKHQGLQAKHYEAYYTDLQLFRVTRDLQKVILDGENANNQKVRARGAMRIALWSHLLNDLECIVRCTGPCGKGE